MVLRRKEFFARGTRRHKEEKEKNIVIKQDTSKQLFSASVSSVRKSFFLLCETLCLSASVRDLNFL